MTAIATYLPKFNEFNEKHSLFNASDRILLAVSGGMDSMIMVSFFKEAGVDFGIAHCNFSLRGEEADLDEAFVQKLATDLNVPYYVKKFDTLGFAATNKLSTQMAARELRYHWFEDLLKLQNYSYVATAHHKNDMVETMLINLVRGTGIAGLHGILPKRKNTLRPLLFLTREEIAKIAKTDKIEFREDSSNSSNKYLRNKLRHEVIPVLQEINPDLEESFMTTAENVRAAETLLELYLQDQKSELFTSHGVDQHINISKLKEHSKPTQLLYELLKPYDFLFSQVEELIQAFNGQPGKQFFSPSYKLIKDRNDLIISPLKKEDEETLNMNTLFTARIETNKSFGIPYSKTIGCFDFDKLVFPLNVRYWQAGDTFVPLGLARKKKLSDFLIDLKLSRSKKEKVKVVLSGDEIIWVAGQRISDKFKITDDTKTIYILTMNELDF
ncbi:tRNA lysidine(34) synthetase TilS [Solitalea koreensis]|uniref:tRNA(Ile)-lysidine synthase n=1 Tax=Solitalea koreensis TaxID=543615 RepID=A0A521AS03_9SPHI|nr:tRNA lysidine(34) synthetase TilS [Solitalea koreensis]SMO37566.1 tRNA(Ile)-lysidine synthase [Solitalea koreensis]